KGVEVVHLGHNRSVDDILQAALQEDADAIALSSYHGGHNEFFAYLVDQLKENGAEHIKVFGGGGGTITPEEIADLQAYGVERIYHPQDGMQLGLLDMIDDVVQRSHAARIDCVIPAQSSVDKPLSVAQMLSAIENASLSQDQLNALRVEWAESNSRRKVPVIGVTGTGGAGKSSLTDEVLNRFSEYLPEKKIAVLAVDPTRRRTGGALLGDRIRMNSLRNSRIYMRSMATRRQHAATNLWLADSVAYLKSVGFDLVIVETAGIGQGDSEIVDLVDLSMYVMTSEFGAASQLEKIDMIDFADAIIINKFEKKAALDALRDVRKQYRRNRNAFAVADEDLPIYPTIASQFMDPGVNWLFVNLCRQLVDKCGLDADSWQPSLPTAQKMPQGHALIPGDRIRYLAEIADQGRGINRRAEQQAKAARQAQQFYGTLSALGDSDLPAVLGSYSQDQLTVSDDPTLQKLRRHYQDA
ncbi:MAG: methylmalonyl-CoA mutase, partial [Gammaproteobacteria bacterium]|nr:methylmalonyl-CoA mutase [Gammaproteobacteria bacterium]